jgi:hypothetical protein
MTAQPGNWDGARHEDTTDGSVANMMHVKMPSLDEHWAGPADGKGDRVPDHLRTVNLSVAPNG